MKKKSMDWYKQQQRFSVRKYHFGAASVLLGTALVFGGAQVSADEVSAPATPSTESTTATSAETTTASEEAPAVLTASEATPASLTASEASSSTEATSLDKGALQVALSQAKALDLSNKTSETVAILLAQIEHAQTVLNTATSQEELNQAVADLQAAQAQLADKPAQPVAVSPASVATTPAPATSTTSSTPEATTPASTSTSTASTETSTASTETSTSPTVSTRSRRTRRDTSASTHTPVEVNSTSTGSINNSNVNSDTIVQDFSVTTKLTQPAKEGDYVEYEFKNLGVYYLPGTKVSYNGLEVGTIELEHNDEYKDVVSPDPNVRQNAQNGMNSGKIFVKFNKNIENLTNVEYTISATHVDSLHTSSINSWNMETYLKDKQGMIFYDSVTIPGRAPSTVPNNLVVQSSPVRVVKTNDNVIRGGIRKEIHNPANSPLKVGDFISYELLPESVVRFDLSNQENVPGRTSTIETIAATEVNRNNVLTRPNRTMTIELVSATDTKLVFKVNSLSEGEGIYFFDSPVVLTDVNGIDLTNQTVGPAKLKNEGYDQNGQILSSTTAEYRFNITGILSNADAIIAPRSSVYVQYVDESGTPIPGTTKTTLLNNEVTGTPYTASGLDLVAFPNYTFVKMQDGSAPATGNSTTTDLTVTYVYHYNTEAERFTPNGQDLTVKHNDTPSAEDGIANKTDLPTGTTYAWKGTAPDTSTPGTKPATITVSYPDGSSEDVNVNVNVTPRADDYTPIGKDVPAKHGDTPSAASGIANKGDLPADATYTWKGTAPDTTTPGDKPATVVVTYDDGTVDEVPVTVKVQPQADDYDPQAQPVSVDHGATPNAEDGIANKGTLPPGTTYDWKTPIDTSTPGTKPGTVVVTYPDGTKDEVPVPVTVGEEAALYTPVGQDVPAKHGETPAASQGIANRGTLPAGTTYDWKTPVDTSTPGDKPATVVVTYPDGTKDEVPVTVKVKPQSDEFTPQPKDVSTDHGKTPKAEDGVANKGDLPDGTKYDWKTPVDTTTPGDKPGTVVVTYPDGTKDEVPVTVHVGSQSDLYNPDGQNLNVKQGDQPEASKGIANRGNLPDGTTYDWKTPVDTSTVGDKPATVVVTYPDGSKDEVPVTVKVTEKLHVKTPADKVPVKDPSNLTPDDINKVVENIKKENPGLPDDAKITVNPNGGDTTIETKDGDKVTIPGSDLVRPETDANKNNVKVPADKVPVKDPSNLTDAEKDKVKDNIKKANPDLPNGTKIDVAKDGTATITFPDGSTKVIPGTDLVRPEADADRHTPKGQDVPVKQGETPKAEDGIANKGDLPNGTKIEWKETPDTSKVGDHNATIVITYPDGSKDEVTVTVKVSPNANNNGYNGNNGSHGNGNSGSHNNGTNGDQGQGNKDKKDQAGKDTNNGLDKLFSNSGNGSASGDQSGASRKQAPALPNTGDDSNPAMALAFAALLGGTALAMKKRKKEEE